MWNESVPWEVMPEVFKCSVPGGGLKWSGDSFSFLEHLRHNFSRDRLISRQTGPSYSQDLNPPDYFLSGYLKNRVCENNPQTREGIIRKEIRRIAQEMLNRVVDNFIVRVLLIQQRRAWNEHSINYWKSIVKYYWF